MKSIAFGLVVSASLFATTGNAACEIPSLIASIPEGTTATEEELLAVQAEVQAYVAAMDDYIACQNEELTTTGENASADFLFHMSNRIQSARQEVDSVATKFNDQVNAFRAARAAASAPNR